MSTSRHVQHLDPADLPRVDADGSPHVPAVVDLAALRVAPRAAHAARPPATPFAWVVDTGSQAPVGARSARPAGREPTFDELVHGVPGASADGEGARGPRGWFGRRGRRSRGHAPGTRAQR